MKLRDTPVVEALGRRLRMVMGRVDDSVPPQTPTAQLPPQVEFIGYAEDCVLTGRIRMDSARLTDLLNAHDEFELVDVGVESLAGDTAIEVKDVVVARDELMLVQAVGPRGDRRSRIRTRQHPLAMQVGPYHVRGYLHALPGSDPIASFRHRKTMVPLTDAWIEYDQRGTRQRHRAATVVVNRHQLDWVVEAPDEAVEMPDITLQYPAGPLVKDFTGKVRND
jgi:hypothetical protein